MAKNQNKIAPFNPSNTIWALLRALSTAAFGVTPGRRTGVVTCSALGDAAGEINGIAQPAAGVVGLHTAVNIAHLRDVQIRNSSLVQNQFFGEFLNFHGNPPLYGIFKTWPVSKNASIVHVLILFDRQLLLTGRLPFFVPIETPFPGDHYGIGFHRVRWRCHIHCRLTGLQHM